MSDIRRFVVTRVQKPGQKGANTSYNSQHSVAGKTPGSAATKAFGKLCKKKSIKGQCTLNVTIKEIQTTPGGNASRSDKKYILPEDTKEYKYRLKRRVSKEKVKYGDKIVTHKYKSTIRSLK